MLGTCAVRDDAFPAVKESGPVVGSSGDSGVLSK
jgi:hypothetical protein